MNVASCGRQIAVAATAALVVAGCSGVVVAPDGDSRCKHPDPAKLAHAAVAALKVVPFLPRPLYGTDASGKGVPFPLGDLTADARAVITYPYPTRFTGAPAGLSRLANRSYTYDNALYALWMTAERDQAAAAAVLQTLVALQRDDGAWGFSFDARLGNFYNGGYVRTGVVAWVVYALARYQAHFKDPRFAAATEKGARWLSGRYDAKLGLLRGGFGKWLDDGARFEPGYIADWASTEHNVDAFFAFRELERAGLSGGRSSVELADTISTRLFIASERRYAQGLQVSGLDRVSALDAAGTWTALFALAANQPQRASYALEWIARHHKVQDGGWRGFKPYRKGPQVWFVEGSMAHALVDHRLGRSAPAKALLMEAARLACVGGVPLLYSTSWAKDFPATPAAAPTLWYALVAREVAGGAEPFLWN